MNILSGVRYLLLTLLVGKDNAINNIEKEQQIMDRLDELNRIKNRIETFVYLNKEADTSLQMRVDFEFPKDFVKQKNRFIKGDVVFRDFVSGVSEDEKVVVSGQARMTEGSEILTICHDNAITYIYMITGTVIDKASGMTLTPYSEVPYRIDRGQRYSLSCLTDSNFVIKFIRQETA